MRNNILNIAKNPIPFFSSTHGNSPIALASTVRLARNLANYPFPISADMLTLHEIKNSIADYVLNNNILGKNVCYFDIDKLSNSEKNILYERCLISLKLLEISENRALICTNNENFSMMINEEDHIRMQAFSTGCNFKKCWNKVNAIDSAINKNFDFAFDTKLGYLTTSPANIGTGLRASAILHLPALTINKDIHSVTNALAKLDFLVRGIYGEGDKIEGSLYQISNQMTLGESEEDILNCLEVAIEKVIDYEQTAREELFLKRKNEILDIIGKSYGTLKYSYLLSRKDLLDALSNVKLGVDMEVFSRINNSIISNIFMVIGDAHLEFLTGETFEGEQEKNAARAQFCREKIRNKR